MEKFINKILHGDNIKIMNKMQSESIDLIFADPPYNMNLQKDLFRYNGNKFEGVNDLWDKYHSLKEYDEECKTWLKECLRLLKKNGSLWVIGSFQNIHRLGYILQDLDAWIINEIVWEKNNPVPNFNGTRFVNAQETMLWVVKDKKAKFTFNYKTMKHINGGKQMKSVWRFNICTGNERLKDSDGKKIHSTQKPLELLERIVLASSKIGDVVLDPFSGTGATAHAAKKWGRKYIAIENNLKYVQASEERLEKASETFENEDLKKAIYDIKPKKVTFLDLLKSELLSTEDNLIIKGNVFNFNSEGSIFYGNQKITPNKLCKIIFGKPTNAWDNIYFKGEKISKLRDLLRENSKPLKTNNSFVNLED